MSKYQKITANKKHNEITWSWSYMPPLDNTIFMEESIVEMWWHVNLYKEEYWVPIRRTLTYINITGKPRNKHNHFKTYVVWTFKIVSLKCLWLIYFTFCIVIGERHGNSWVPHGPHHCHRISRQVFERCKPQTGRESYPQALII